MKRIAQYLTPKSGVVVSEIQTFLPTGNFGPFLSSADFRFGNLVSVWIFIRRSELGPNCL